MKASEPKPRRETWMQRTGWLLLSVLAGLVLLSGVYPLLAEPENRESAAALIAFAIVAIGTAAGPLRRGHESAWKALWTFPAGLGLIAVVSIGTGGTAAGGSFLLVTALAVIVLATSRPRTTATAPTVG